MIDRQARDRAAELLRHFAAGQRTNDEFEDSWPSSWQDPSVDQVFWGGAWGLYGGTRCHRLSGRDRLDRQVRREVARWVLFLKSNLPYEWPRVSHHLSLLLLFPNLLTMGLVGWLGRRWFACHGDYEVWPFIRRSDLEVALCRPCYLRRW